MKVIQSGYNYRQDADYIADRPDGLADYLLLIIRSPAHLKIREQDYYVKENAVILYSKGTPQYFAAHKADYINDWVTFQMNEKDLAFCRRKKIPFDTLLELPDITKLSRLVALLFEERWSPDNKNTEESKTLLLRLLLLKLSDICSDMNQSLSPFHMRLKILRSNIKQFPDRDWSIDTVCKTMSISRTYLYVTYKQLFGRSIQEDVTTSRIDRAKHLLTTTNYSITTIADMVGYHSDVHFMHMFKKQTGFSPLQYRRSYDSYFDYPRYDTQWSQKHP